MAKCFMSGIEMQLDNACVLDRDAAKRAVLNLRQHLAALEPTVAQLTPKGSVSVLDRRAGTTKSRSQARLIRPTVATALSAAYGEVWRAVVRGGLDPYFGLVHGSSRDDGSLVFDLIEEY